MSADKSSLSHAEEEIAADIINLRRRTTARNINSPTIMASYCFRVILPPCSPGNMTPPACLKSWRVPASSYPDNTSKRSLPLSKRMRQSNACVACKARKLKVRGNWKYYSMNVTIDSPSVAAAANPAIIALRSAACVSSLWALMNTENMLRDRLSRSLPQRISY